MRPGGISASHRVTTGGGRGGVGNSSNNKEKGGVWVHSVCVCVCVCVFRSVFNHCYDEITYRASRLFSDQHP